MKKILFSSLLLLSIHAYAAQKAITATGDEVLLHDNGTWVYADASKKPAPALTKNPTPFVKPADASFEVKSKVNKASVWIDPKAWKFNKAENNEAAEYEFQLQGADLYGLMINEAIEIPVDSLTRIALDNARKVAPDASIAEQEYRTVNNREVIYARIDGTMQGISLSYLSYYVASSSGSTQLVLYTGRNLVDKYRTEIDAFLNGLMVQ